MQVLAGVIQNHQKSAGELNLRSIKTFRGCSLETLKEQKLIRKSMGFQISVGRTHTHRYTLTHSSQTFKGIVQPYRDIHLLSQLLIVNTFSSMAPAVDNCRSFYTSYRGMCTWTQTTLENMKMTSWDQEVALLRLLHSAEWHEKVIKGKQSVSNRLTRIGVQYIHTAHVDPHSHRNDELAYRLLAETPESHCSWPKTSLTRNLLFNHKPPRLNKWDVFPRHMKKLLMYKL